LGDEVLDTLTRLRRSLRDAKKTRKERKREREREREEAPEEETKARDADTAETWRGVDYIPIRMARGNLDGF